MNGPANGDDLTGRRMIRRVALSVSGGALLTVATFAVADAASAADTVEQVGPGSAPPVSADGTSPPVGQDPTGLDAEVRSEGEATATSGGQLVVGNDSTSTAIPTTEQPPVDGSDPTGADDLGPHPTLTDPDLVGDLGDPGPTTVPEPGDDDTVVEVSSDVVNVGVGIAVTGGNVAIGNDSSNVTSGGSGSSSPTGAATAGNESTGTAEVVTGGASAVGNDATVGVDQEWVGIIASDGVLYLVERSRVLNAGLGIAVTGDNSATGNSSSNTAVAGAGPGSGSGTATNASNGSAAVSSGAASALGNDSSTTVVQVIGVVEDGSIPVVIEQISIIVNVSVSLANTGGNLALGNVSINSATVGPQIEAAIDDALRALLSGPVGSAGTPVAVSAGVVTDAATNQSTGFATITTGAASAVGNQSVTTVTQGMLGTVVGEGVIYIIQQSVVINIGVAVADTGGNVAIGNASTNTAAVSGQQASGGTSVVSGTATNTSNGVAIITTGKATAVGSTALTTVVQIVSLESTTETPVPFLLVQTSVVHNITIDLATTGANVAIGNSSHNDAELGLPEGALAAIAAIDGVAPGDAVAPAVAVAVAANVSDGTAVIVTGDAVAGVVVTPPEPPEPPAPVPVQPPAPPAAPAPAPIGQGAAPAASPTGSLPYTGADVGTEAMAGILLVAAGAVIERRSRLSRLRRR